MAIADMIPDLNDQELANLRANACRLELAGTPRQKAQAAELTPLIEAELAVRIARKPPKAKRAAPKRKVALNA
jgi:nucleoid-associated protein YgaU